jgi:hypothetical protein
MPVRRKIVFTLLMMAAFAGACWLGLWIWRSHERTVFYKQLAEARALRGQARYTEAEPKYRETFAVARRVFGPAHAKTLGTEIEWFNVVIAAGSESSSPFTDLVDIDSNYVRLPDPEYREPDRLVRILEQLHLLPPSTRARFYFACIDATGLNKAYYHPVPLEPEGSAALAELVIRIDRGTSKRSNYGAYGSKGRYLLDLSKYLQQQKRNTEAMIAAHGALEFHERLTEGSTATLRADRKLAELLNSDLQEAEKITRELEAALQHEEVAVPASRPTR